MDPHNEKAAHGRGGLSEAGATPQLGDAPSEARDLAARQDAALRLAGLGFVVGQSYWMTSGGVCSCGEIGCRSPGKHPFGGDTRSTTDPEQIRAWWTERPYAGVFVNLAKSGLVDVSSDAAQTLVDFRRLGLPETASFESGSGAGHQHHLYRLPADAPQIRECKSGVSDLMSAGIALLPPSVSGKGEYRWLREPVEPVDALPPAPAWVVAALHEHEDREYEQPDIDWNAPPVRLSGTALDFWNGTKSSRTDGEIDRSQTLAAIGHFLADAGLSAAAICRALEDRDTTLGLDKYTGRRDAEKRYAEIAIKATKGKTTAPAASALSRFELIDFADVRNLPRPAWLVEGLLVQNSIATLYGPSGTGKTFAAIDLAMHIALGRSWYGRTTTQGPVAYIACEDGEGVGYRIDGWCRHHKIEIEAMRGAGKLVASAANLRDPAEVEALQTALESMPEPPKLVVIDTLAWAMAGGDENSTQDVMAVMDAARRLHEALGCAVLLVHHTRKSDEVERGSSALRAGSYTMLKLTGEDTIRLEVDKQKGGAKGDPMSFRLVTVRMEPEGTVMLNTTCVLEQVRTTDPAGSNLAGSERRLLLALYESFTVGEAVSYSRISAVAGDLRGKTFERALKGLKERGFLIHEGPRKPYTLTESGAKQAAPGAKMPPPGLQTSPDRPIHNPITNTDKPTDGPTVVGPDPTGSEAMTVAGGTPS